MNPIWWFLLGSFVAIAPCLFIVALLICRSMEGKRR